MKTNYKPTLYMFYRVVKTGDKVKIVREWPDAKDWPDTL